MISSQGTLQTFVDDLFQVILSTSRPVPLAIKYFFDLLDDQAQLHGISDQDTIHIWKTNRSGASWANGVVTRTILWSALSISLSLR